MENSQQWWDRFFWANVGFRILGGNVFVVYMTIKVLMRLPELSASTVIETLCNVALLIPGAIAALPFALIAMITARVFRV